MSSSRTSRITRWSQGATEEVDDQLSVEEPLQVVVDGRPLAVLMRTPGEDLPLVTGFLLTEGIISEISHIRRIDLEARDNHALVFLADDHPCDWDRLTRHLFSASSCGLCGKATIDAILQSHPPIEEKPSFDPEVIQQAPAILRAAQANFDSTGGIHASGIFSKNGELLVLHEDVGRHNALDKVIGEGLSRGIDFSRTFLLVSGRISFELMQKSLAARIPLVAGISAPSSLALEFARTSNQSLIGFLRPPSMNIYH
ncbi:MAG: formate dehydrogenase accessory sulfurtransferase FdhD [Akkermansiaceae bacterium]|jgi:FdhD protein